MPAAYAARLKLTVCFAGLFSTRVPRKAPRKSFTINKTAKTSRHTFGCFASRPPLPTFGATFFANTGSSTHLDARNERAPHHKHAQDALSSAAMASDGTTVVGLGEVLWDMLPAGKQLGGAPANFAYICSLLGHRAIVASAVGTDPLGKELRERLAQLALDAAFIQRDPCHPTGVVNVSLDQRGQPEYEIEQNVAWDFLSSTPEWQQLAAHADVICFGTLAQRSASSRATIQAFLRARPDAIRIFDVNLRQNFFSADVLTESLRLANVVKLNDAELPVVTRCLELSGADEKSRAENLRRAFGLNLVCVTRGSRGSLLVRESECDEHPGFSVQVQDLVGAGDAFTAALAHHLLRGSSLCVMNEAANRMGAWVASQAGATPRPHADVLAGIV
jgi:fructokinase